LNRSFKHQQAFTKELNLKNFIEKNKKLLMPDAKQDN